MAKILMNKTLRTLFMETYFARNASIANRTETMMRNYASTRSGEPELIKEKMANKAFLTLNRGASKNALTLELTNEIIATLNEWENDNQIASIILKSKCGAFSADIDLADASYVAQDRMHVESVPGLIESCYKLHYRIGTLKKPNAILVNGEVHSSAIGVTHNHTYSVCTENAVFSMPETGYGLVPNCYFASRIPDKLGLYLALTGNPIKGRDLYNIGLTTHYIRAAKLQNLENDIKKVDDIEAVIDGINRYRKMGENYKKETIINFYRIYELMKTVKSVDDLFQILKEEALKGDEWSKEQITILSRKSPLALKITYKYFDKHECDLKQCLKMHYRFTKRLIGGQDFQESLRSVIGSKETMPKWSQQLNQIDDETVNSFFDPLPSDELKLD